ncbi:barstar family protein [Streptomyces sp. G44]|uniref:barstar family protein n=1 Tax=Streptomyces sp. G44 TaxID=2807632 RepID=UPI00196143AD|nr:barstar family protein [Streptomyces sp. G44]MBM7172562.1 barstar family protein [Streptomyces sp. G44]
MPGGTDTTPDPLTPVLHAARDAGWTTAALSLAGVRDKAAFMERCARGLGLPDWFGHNWDALADCLGDLSWAPPARGRLLVVSGWQEYAHAEPGEWETAQEVFSSAVEHWRGAETGLEIVLALGPAAAARDGA